MPRLRSLRSGPIDISVVERSVLAPLEVLALWDTDSISLQRHFQSLTTLMLEAVTLRDAISDPVEFPSLTFLSLWNMPGLKPHLNAPCRTTYHEGGTTQSESFSAPLHSLVEYGIYGLESSYSEWHLAFPNLSRLSIRTNPPTIISFLDFFSNHRHSFPLLQTISAGFISSRFTKAEREIMEAKVRDLDVVLHLGAGASFHIPMFFGDVSHRPSNHL